MPSVNIPPDSIQSNFKFRFSDDPQDKKVVRRGDLIPIKTSEVRPSDKWYDYHNKRHHQLVKSMSSQLNWCILCSQQATHVLLFRNYGAWQLYKFCSDHVQKYIIKL